MLNEVYEFMQFTEQLLKPDVYKEKYGTRLQYSNLIHCGKKQGKKASVAQTRNSSEIIGINGPLTIIARGKLFSEEYSRITANDIKAVQNDLSKWCFEQTGWLAWYLNNVINTELRMENIHNALTDFQKKREVYSKKEFNKNLDTQSDLKHITFDKIIARALDTGPLKQYYLVADCAQDAEKTAISKEQVGDIYEQYVFAGIFKPFPNRKNDADLNSTDTENIKKYKSIVLMAVAAFLLSAAEAERFNLPNSEEIIAVTDFYNWIQKKSQSLKDLDFYYLEESTQLISTNFIFPGNTSIRTISINRPWLDKCNWKLMEEAELKQMLREPGKQKTLFYRDYYCGIDKKNVLVKRKLEHEEASSDSFYIDENAMKQI